jgi:hypothetical protein
MSFSSTTLRPGLLVSVKTSISGNVTYNKRELEAEQINVDGVLHAKWETEKTILDAAEHEKATKVRSKARSLIGSVCANSAFGLLCPESASDDLEKAIAEARKLCEQFNDESQLTRVKFYVITGRIAPDDVEAVRAINSEVRELLASMEEGVAKIDVKAIRDAADRAKQLGSMLSADAQARIQIAIDAARSAAKKIVKAGEQAAIEIDRRTLSTLAEARTAFLDIDAQGEIGTPAAEGRAIDLAPEHVQIGTPASPDRKLEIV